VGPADKVKADATTMSTKYRPNQSTVFSDQSSSVSKATDNPKALYFRVVPCYNPVQFFVTNGTTNLGSISTGSTMPNWLTVQKPNSALQNTQQLTTLSRLKRVRSQERVIKDSIYYLSKVKTAFCDQPQAYRNLLEVLTECKTKVIDTVEMMNRIAKLLKNHPELILDFNSFLPMGYEMKTKFDKKGKFVSIFLHFADGSTQTILTDPTDLHTVSSTTPTVTTTTVAQPPVASTSVSQDQSKGQYYFSRDEA